MPRYKSDLGTKPPELLRPRGRERKLRINFDPLTLRRDVRTAFDLDQERDARKWLKKRWQEALRQKKAGAKAAAEGRRLTATLEDCLQRALKRGIRVNTEKPLATKTMNAYEDSVDLFMRWLADHRPELAPFRIGDIDRELVTEYVGFRTSHFTVRVDDQRRKPPTERSMYKQVMGIQWAVLRGAPLNQLEDKHYNLVPRNISGKSQPRGVYLTAEQMVEYFRAILDLGYPGLLAMAICEALLGMRRGDALGLSRDSFAQTEGYRFVMIANAAKNRPRAVILLPEVCDLVDEYVIPALPIELPWMHEEDSIYHTLRKAAKKAKVPYASPNDLRASFSVLLLNRGVPATIVAEMMGTSVKMLEDHYDRANEVGISLERQRVKLEAARAAGHFSELLPNKPARTLMGKGGKS